LQRDKGKDKEKLIEKSSNQPTASASQPTASASEQCLQEGSPPAAPTAITDCAPEASTHPFQNTKDANYLPPASQNFAALPKGRAPGYQTLAPIQNPKIAEDVFSKTICTDAITLTFEELLALSPEMHTKYKELLTPKCQLAVTVQTAYNDGPFDEIISPAALENVVKMAPIMVTDDGVVIPDTHEVYNASITTGQRPAL
jgi:hypothetical protein